MTHNETNLAALRRPKTLIRAARHGATRYRRERDLKFLSATGKTLSGDGIVDRLVACEDVLEATRKSGAADYNVHQHVTVLTVLIAEARATQHAA